MRIDPDANLVSAATVGDSPTPIPWGEPFSKRFVLERTENGARLTAAPEPPASKFYTYQALFALAIAVSLSVIPGPGRFPTRAEPWLALVLCGLGLWFMPIGERFVWRSAPGRSSFPRVASLIELRAEFASDTERPYRAATSVPRLHGVVIDGHAFSAGQIEGVRLVEWRTREVDPKYETEIIRTYAALVLIATEDDGQRIPYELDIFKDHDDAALAACTLLARLLAMKPLETVHLPLNVGLHHPWYSAVGYRIMSLLLTFGLSGVAYTSLCASTGAHMICVAAWVVLSSAIIRWHSNREMWQRNAVASKAAKPHRTSRSRRV